MLKPFSKETRKRPDEKSKEPNVQCERCDTEFLMKKNKLFGKSMPHCPKCGGYLELLEVEGGNSGKDERGSKEVQG